MADRTKDHPHLLGQDSKERQDLADHVERLEVALRLAQARNQDLEAALGRIREASESHPECDRYLDSEHMTNIARMPAMSDIDRAELRRLLTEATPGPWVAEFSGTTGPVVMAIWLAL